MSEPQPIDSQAGEIVAAQKHVTRPIHRRVTAHDLARQHGDAAFWIMKNGQAVPPLPLDRVQRLAIRNPILRATDSRLIFAAGSAAPKDDSTIPIANPRSIEQFLLGGGNQR